MRAALFEGMKVLPARVRRRIMAYPAEEELGKGRYRFERPDGTVMALPEQSVALADDSSTILGWVTYRLFAHDSVRA